jgi:hypothetical protein
MTDFDPRLTRRSVVVAGAVTLLQAGTVFAAEEQVITVHLEVVEVACGNRHWLSPRLQAIPFQCANRCPVSPVGAFLNVDIGLRAP